MTKNMIPPEKYIPSKEEKAQVNRFIIGIQQKIIDTINKNTSMTIGDIYTIPTGSTAKGTYISGQHDIDIYVLTKDPKEACTALMNISRNSGFVKHGGTLLIWNFKMDGYEVDAVFSTPDNAKTDTIKHVQFFRDNLTDQEKIDVIRLKVLFKCFGLYGAETGGITGVAIEELIRQLKSAKKILSYFARCKPMMIDWLQDPVLDTPRNLLASVIPRRQQQIIQLAKQIENLKLPVFLDVLLDVHKGIRFTKKDFVTFWEKEKEHSFYLILERKRETHQDFTQILGIANKCLRTIKSIDSDIQGEADVFVDAENIVLAVANLALTLPTYKFYSIEKKYKEAVPEFLKKHPSSVETDDKLITIIPRKIIAPQQYFKSLFCQKAEEMGYIVVP